jgi:hypothetical protein
MAATMTAQPGLASRGLPNTMAVPVAVAEGRDMQRVAPGPIAARGWTSRDLTFARRRQSLRVRRGIQHYPARAESAS